VSAFASPFEQLLSPVSFLERAGEVHAGRVVVTDGDRSYTYAQWRERSRRLAGALRSAGLRKDDRVAFLALNSEPLLLAHFGVPQAGGVLVAVNTRLNADEVGYILDHSEATSVFSSPELEPLLAQAPPGLRRIDLATEFEDFLATGSPDLPESWLEDEADMIAIDYTSGTTGRPKGVVYHHRGAYLNAIGLVLENRLRPESTYLWTLPMFHCNGWSHTWALAAAGARSVAIPRVDPAQIWRMLDTEGVTHLSGAPTVLIMLANDPGAHRLERRIRVTTGGAPPSPTLIAQMEDLNIEMQHLYGLTESYGPFTLNLLQPGVDALPLEERARLMARQGMTHVTAGHQRVVDEEMRDVPADGETMGEVVLRGNAVMKGYHRQPEATEEAFRGGWFHTGDVGVMHPDRVLELRDRIKDIIISGGENISTIEVEQAVMSHPAVLEAAVIAVPDEKWGEVPKAFVTLKPGQSVDERALIEHVRNRIAHYKAPRQIEFGELPKTSTGKIHKFVLRESEWAGRGRRIN
jgi:fatty-acyl-CoA synthase